MRHFFVEIKSKIFNFFFFFGFWTSGPKPGMPLRFFRFSVVNFPTRVLWGKRIVSVRHTRASTRVRFPLPVSPVHHRRTARRHAGIPDQVFSRFLRPTKPPGRARRSLRNFEKKISCTKVAYDENTLTAKCVVLTTVRRARVPNFASGVDSLWRIRSVIVHVRFVVVLQSYEENNKESRERLWSMRLLWGG